MNLHHIITNSSDTKFREEKKSVKEVTSKIVMKHVSSYSKTTSWLMLHHPHFPSPLSPPII